MITAEQVPPELKVLLIAILDDADLWRRWVKDWKRWQRSSRKGLPEPLEQLTQQVFQQLAKQLKELKRKQQRTELLNKIWKKLKITPANKYRFYLYQSGLDNYQDSAKQYNQVLVQSMIGNKESLKATRSFLRTQVQGAMKIGIPVLKKLLGDILVRIQKI